MNTIYVAFAIGLFVGLLVGNKDFRNKVLSFVIKRQPSNNYSSRPNAIPLFAREGGGHYHIKSCQMLSGTQFADLGYKEVDAHYILDHRLRPDICIDRRNVR
jgi:hypothetical protein